MTDFEPSDAPRDISVTKDTRNTYDDLTEANDSPFKNAELNDIFVFAAAYGYNQGLRTSLDSRRALANRDALSDSQQWTLKSIALNETEDEDILRDGKQIYIIAEEYAEGGIHHLKDRLEAPGDLYNEISTEIIQLHQESD